MSKSRPSEAPPQTVPTRSFVRLSSNLVVVEVRNTPSQALGVLAELQPA